MKDMRSEAPSGIPMVPHGAAGAAVAAKKAPTAIAELDAQVRSGPTKAGGRPFENIELNAIADGRQDQEVVKVTLDDL